MRKIKLNSRKGIVAFTIIDDEDYERLSSYRWYMTSTGYVATRLTKIHDCKRVLMHRFILDFPDIRLGDIDHINGDKLDNRKSNLRFATRSQNLGNKRKQSNNTSGYKGVGFYDNRWVATCRRVRVGRFKTIEEAVKAYNEAAIRYYGEYARINVIED